jgi:hypothetical protein
LRVRSINYLENKNKFLKQNESYFSADLGTPIRIYFNPILKKYRNE